MKILVTGGSGFIGTHLLAHLAKLGHEIINVDNTKPRDECKLSIWRNCSILEKTALRQVFRDFQPHAVVHLAAYASVEAKSLVDYRANTDGTANLLECCKETRTIERVVIASTQHVRRPGSPPPTSDVDYVPYMLYGESKVITEQLTRAADLECSWTIIRPTAVWGAGHPFLPDGLWKLMAQGKYFHPSHDPVIRSYGYVKNVAWQIEKLLQSEADMVNRKVFYVADGNIRQYDWVNSFAKQLTGRDVRTVPVSFISLLARIGDGMRAIGLRFPMYSSRYLNLITSNPVPIEPTLQLLGLPPYSLDQGVQETATWFNYRHGNHSE